MSPIVNETATGARRCVPSDTEYGDRVVKDLEDERKRHPDLDVEDKQERYLDLEAMDEQKR